MRTTLLHVHLYIHSLCTLLGVQTSLSIPSNSSSVCSAHVLNKQALLAVHVSGQNFTYLMPTTIKGVMQASQLGLHPPSPSTCCDAHQSRPQSC